jgi:hypothetical protein
MIVYTHVCPFMLNCLCWTDILKVVAHQKLIKVGFARFPPLSYEFLIHKDK